MDHGSDEHRNQQPATERTHEPIAGQQRALGGAGGHHAHERGVGDVDGRVQHHHQGIGHPGVDQLAGVVEVRVREHQIAHEAVRESHPEQVRAIFSVPSIGPVCQRTHEWIVHGIPELRDEKQRSHRRRRDAEDVRVVVEQKDVEGLEEEIGGRVAERVAELFVEAKRSGAGGWHVWPSPGRLATSGSQIRMTTLSFIHGDC